MSGQQEQYDRWAEKQAAMGRRVVPEDEKAPIPEIYLEPEPETPR